MKLILSEDGEILVNADKVLYYAISPEEGEPVDGFSVLAWFSPSEISWARLLKCDTQLEATQYLIRLHKELGLMG